MNINELANVNSFDIDITTGVKVSHEKKYSRVINKLGYENVKKCIPFTIDQLVKFYKVDEYFNNGKLTTWDSATYKLHALYRENKVTSWSLSDGVCILKQCAKKWVKEAEVNNNTFNGWKNIQTWNVMLYIKNDSNLYELLKEFLKQYKGRAYYKAYIDYIGYSKKSTPDGHQWISRALDYKRLNEAIKECKQ